MRNLLILLLIITVAFTSCEGRKSLKKSLSESVADFKENSKTERNLYYPEAYREFESDTLLSDGHRVKITNFTNMNKDIIKEEIKNIEILRKHYRELNSKIVITHNGKQIFDKTIDNNYLKSVVNLPNTMDEPTQLLGVWVNQYESLLSNTIVLDISYTGLKSKNLKTCKLKIRRNGNYDFVST